MGNEFQWLEHEYGKGAWEKFEELCFDIFDEKYQDYNVQRIKGNPGDQGIDISIREINSEIYIIAQCKFYLNGIKSGHISKIKESFEKALGKGGKEITDWILCLPISMKNNELDWWDEWSAEKIKEFKVKYNKKLKIKLYTQGKLIKLAKKYNVYDSYFKDMYRKNSKKKERFYQLLDEINGLDCDFRNVIERIELWQNLSGKKYFRDNTILNELKQIARYLAKAGVINIIYDETERQEINRLLESIYKQANDADW